MNQHPLVDYDFGLSQLCGNKPLFLSMLGKFCDEYAEVGQRVINLCAQGEIKEARSKTHALKGVSGNLGLKAAHSVSRELEKLLREQEFNDDILQQFNETLNATVNSIQVLMQSSIESAENSPHEAAQSTLITKLERNEFISHEELSNLLSGTALTPKDKQKLADAVNDLEYDQALSIIKA